MTGNTNVKDGISLNASVVTKEVETGQSVIAGNFVQYKTVSSTQTTNVSLSPTSDELDLIQNISGEYYVGLFRDGTTYNSLKLLKINNSGITFLDTFAVHETQCFSFCIQSGNIYACFGKTLYRFRIENDEFVVDDSLDFSSDYTASGAVLNLIYYNGKLFAVARTVDIIVFDVSQSTMSYFNKYSSVLFANNNRRCKLIKEEGNSLTLYYVTNSYYEQNPTKYYGIDKCSLNNDGTVSGNTSLMNYVEGKDSSIEPIYASWIDTESFVLFSAGSAASHKILDIINVVQNSRTTINLYDIDRTSTDYFVHRINTTRFAFNMSSQLFVATVNKNTNTITITSNKLSTLSVSRSNGSAEPIIFGKDVYVFGASKVIKQYMNDNYDYLYDEEDRDYVRNWDGESRLIGVAKQSGSAGETIEVYVPEV